MEQWRNRVRWAGDTVCGPRRARMRSPGTAHTTKGPRVSLRRTIAAVSLSAFALGGLAACGGEDDDTRQTAPEPTTSAQT